MIEFFVITISTIFDRKDQYLTLLKPHSCAGKALQARNTLNCEPIVLGYIVVPLSTLDWFVVERHAPGRELFLLPCCELQDSLGYKVKQCFK